MAFDGRIVFAAFLPTPLTLYHLVRFKSASIRTHAGGLWGTFSADSGLLQWGFLAIGCLVVAGAYERRLTWKEGLFLVQGAIVAAVLLFALFVPLVDPPSALSLRESVRVGGQGVGLFVVMVLGWGQLLRFGARQKEQAQRTSSNDAQGKKRSS